MRPRPIKILTFVARRGGPGPIKVGLVCLALVCAGVFIAWGRMPQTSDGNPADSAGVSLQPGEPEAPPEPQSPTEPEVKLIAYTVRSGDTLSSISQEYHTTVESIICINSISSPDRLSVGMELSVICNASGLVKRVASGDTLWDISRKFEVSVDDIVRVNKLEDASSLTLGQLLILPGAKLALAAEARTASVSRGTAFLWPLSGSITSAYGWRTHPLSGKRQFHEGLDIAADSGTRIRAAASGKVTFAGWLGAYGRLVTIDHGNGYETRYGHLSGFAVSSGTWVSAGDVVGYVGTSGGTTGPHCHFEIRLKGKTQNPRSLLP